MDLFQNLTFVLLYPVLHNFPLNEITYFYQNQWIYYVMHDEALQNLELLLDNPHVPLQQAHYPKAFASIGLFQAEIKKIFLNTICL